MQDNPKTVKNGLCLIVYSPTGGPAGDHNRHHYSLALPNGQAAKCPRNESGVTFSPSQYLMAFIGCDDPIQIRLYNE
jgi:hypothetical protein